MLHQHKDISVAKIHIVIMIFVKIVEPHKQVKAIQDKKFAFLDMLSVTSNLDRSSSVKIDLVNYTCLVAPI